MVERALHIGNVAACVGAAADVAYARGAATLIGGALSGTVLWKHLRSEEQTLAQEMARVLDQHLAQSHLTADRRKITVQVFARFPPGLEDMAQGDMEAGTIAAAMCDRVRQEGPDPAHLTDQALDDYAHALCAMTQMNLGKALASLGERESGTARLEDSVTAYRAALEELTRDRVPLQRAITQANLASLEIAFFDKTGGIAQLDRAEECARAAKEVFDAEAASRYVEMIDKTLAAIAVRRGGRPPPQA